MHYPLILLAAGKSSRMGFPKGRLSIQGTALLTHQWQRFSQAGGQQGWVVLAEGDSESEPLIPPWVTVLHNPNPQRGTFSSLQIGVSAARAAKAPGAFVLPLDVPAPTAEVWQALATALVTGIWVAVPCFEQRGGHPVLLSAPMLEGLGSKAPGDRLDAIIRQLEPTQIVRVGVKDSSVLANWNSPADLPSPMIQVKFVP